VKSEEITSSCSGALAGGEGEGETRLKLHTRGSRRSEGRGRALCTVCSDDDDGRFSVDLD
jgi:hypothetical protein